MAPRPTKRQKKTAPKDSEDKLMQGQSDVDADEKVKAAQTALIALERRRASKLKSLEEEHQKEVKNVEDKINSMFEKRRQRVSKSQVAQWEKLNVLNKKRMRLEGLILATMKSMERDTVNLCTQLSTIFAGRIEDIQGIRLH